MQTPSDIGAWYSEVKVPIYWAVAADRIVAITKEVVLIVKFKIIKMKFEDFRMFDQICDL